MGRDARREFRRVRARPRAPIVSVTPSTPTWIAASARAAPPVATAPQPQRQVADRLAVAILYTPVIGVTLLSKFVINLGGSEILIGVPLILMALCVGIVSGRLKPVSDRLALYLGMAAVLTLQQALAVNTFSPTAILLLLALHLPYAFALEGSGDPLVHHQRFLNLALFLCLAGILQYFAQFLIGVKYAYPIEHFTPAAFLTHGYNYLNPLGYGSHTMKANGVFLLEPSYFSQLLATGFAIEAVGPQRVWRLLCFCVGFVVSYSGTGLLMMAVTLPTLIIVYRRYSILVFLGLVGIVVVVAGDLIGLDIFASRLSEFTENRTSGYQRYVGPILMFDQYLWTSMQRTLFGVGAGMMMRMTPAPMYFVAETGWAKIILEFGLVGAFAYFGFLYRSIFTAKQSIVLRVNLAMMTLMSGILDGPPHGMILSLLLWLGASAGAQEVSKQPARVQRIASRVVPQVPSLPRGKSN
jgi:hypothetical protein